MVAFDDSIPFLLENLQFYLLAVNSIKFNSVDWSVSWELNTLTKLKRLLTSTSKMSSRVDIRDFKSLTLPSMAREVTIFSFLMFADLKFKSPWNHRPSKMSQHCVTPRVSAHFNIPIEPPAGARNWTAATI